MVITATTRLAILHHLSRGSRNDQFSHFTTSSHDSKPLTFTFVMHEPNLDTGPAGLKNSPHNELLVIKVRNAIITRSMFALTIFGLHQASVFEDIPRRFKYRFWVTSIGSLLKNRLHFIDNGSKYYSVPKPYIRKTGRSPYTAKKNLHIQAECTIAESG